MTKKIFAMFLAVLMVISLLPTSVFAAEKTCPGKGNHTPDNCNNTVVKVVDPTCAVKGFTRYKCNDCGEEFDGSVVSATGKHNYVDAADKAPTCEAAGYKGAKVCSDCGDVKAATTIPAVNGGKYACQWKIVNNATCTEGGTQEWECSVCGAKKTVKVAKGEHKWGEIKVIKAATATENGLATRTCSACGEVKEITVFYNHNCKTTAILVKVDPTCTTAGVKAHYECRVCGNYYKAKADGSIGDKITEQKDIDKLAIPASHTFEKDGVPYTATCADSLLYCTVCKQWVNPGVEHDIDWKVTEAEEALGAQYVAATCVKPGYIYDLCKNCNVRHLKTLDALGHNLVTVTVPATCGQISYTYSYCTRKECNISEVNTPVAVITDKNGIEYNVQVDKFTPVTSITHASANVEAGFYFGFYQEKLDTTLFFNGEMSGNFLATTNDVSKAAKVYVELVSNGKDKKTNEDFNGYRLFFYDAEGTKTYITMEEYKDGKYYKANVVLTTETPATYFTWTNGYFVYTPDVEDATPAFRFGTYNTFGTISATESYYWTKDNQFFASLSSVGVKGNVPVVTYTFNYDGKINESNHARTEKVIDVKPGCTTEGSGKYVCLDCGKTVSTFTIPATHNYEFVYTGKVNKEDAYKAAGCVDGYIYKVCKDCEDAVKVTLPGYGHVMGQTVKFKPSHAATSGYDTTSCRIVGCTHVVKGEYRVWDGLNKTYTSVNEAVAAGWQISGTGTVLYVGDCTNASRVKYTCTCGCNKTVIINVVTDGHGQHKMELGGYVAPTCTEDGGYYSFKCTCGAIVGNAPVAADGEDPTSKNWNKINKTGHNFVVADKHECKDCDSPDDSKVHATCTNEGCTETQKCFTKLSEVKVENGKQLCVTTTMEYYYCRQCNAEHIRSYIVEMGHNYVAYEFNADGSIALTKKPTCTAEGEYNVKCTICGDVSTKKVAKVAHKNKDGVEFWDKCGDTVEDRHCVNCCECASKGTSHDCVNNKVNGKVVPCDCVIGTNHTFESVMMPSSCDMPPYLKKTCVDCGHIENDIQTKVNGETVIFCGHKPAEVDYINKVVDGKLTNELVEQRYKGYTYVEGYVYTWYTVEDGQWVKHQSEPYTAKFIERKDATYTEEGYDLMYCQICKSEEKNIKEKLTGLGFQMTVTNANGAKGFTYGSLIEVTISANGNDVSFYGFEFNVESTVAGENAADALRFVGYEAVNPNFNVAVSNAATALANKKVNVVGYANNDASGKMQNISVNGKTDLVKLYFRVVADNAAEYTFGYTAPVVKKISNYTAQEVQNITANLTSVKAKVAKYMDFNNDGFVSTSDAFLAMTLITGEQPDGLTYNVSIDIDKDGEITLADLSALYEHLVGNKSVNDLFKMGIDADELTILGLGKKTVCNNSACKKEISADATYCPFCGNHQ